MGMLQAISSRDYSPYCTVADMQAFAHFVGMEVRGRRTARVFAVLIPGRSVRAFQFLGEEAVYIDNPFFGTRPTHGVVATAVRETTAALLASAARQNAIRDALPNAGVR